MSDEKEKENQKQSDELSDQDLSQIAGAEAVSLSYGKIGVTYQEQKKDGSLGGEAVGGWDAGKK